MTTDASPGPGAKLGPFKDVAAPRDLTGSLDDLRERRRKAEEDAKIAEIAALDEEIAKLQSRLAELPRLYRQSIESCHRTGRLLWARYTDGFETGRSRRASPDDRPHGPKPDQISFDSPVGLSLETGLSSVPSVESPPIEEGD